MKFISGLLALIVTNSYTLKRFGGYYDDRLIYGGKDPTIENFPFIVCLLIGHSNRHNRVTLAGGGSIIHSNWILTSASAVEALSKSDSSYKSVVGNSTYCKQSRNRREPQVNHDIEFSIRHERYRHREISYDVGLVKVKQSFSGVFERPIRFREPTLKTNALAKAFGWEGNKPRDRETATFLRKIRYIEIPLLDNVVCKNHLGLINHRPVRPTEFCAGWFKKEPQNPCFADTGSAVVQKYKRLLFLVGIVSEDITNCTGNIPSIFVNVHKFKTWITNILEKHGSQLNY